MIRSSFNKVLQRHEFRNVKRSSPSKQITRFYEVIRSPGCVSAPNAILATVKKPFYAYDGVLMPTSTTIDIKDKKGIKAMKESCSVARQVLNHARQIIEPGLMTEEIDNSVHWQTMKSGAYPSPLAYRGFPKSVCTSVNNVACHGIPDDRILEDGDIVSVDVSVFHKGYHGDLCETYLVGDVDAEGIRLVETARKCLTAGISVCGPGAHFKEIGKAISRICDDAGYTICRNLVGHGIGTDFHCAPTIFHHDNEHPGTMQPGMVFTIEPVICEGSPEVGILDDGWTVITVDNGRTAQFEHTLLITTRGVQVLTADPNSVTAWSTDKIFSGYNLNQDI